MGVAQMHPADTQTAYGKGVISMLERTLKRAGTGFLLGAAVGNLIAFITAYYSGDSSFVTRVLIDRAGSEAVAFLLQTLLSGAIGIAGFAGMSLYEIESWSMVRTIIVHFSAISAVFIPSAFFLGWISTLAEALIMESFMALWYFVIWVIMSIRCRAAVKELNKLQKEKFGTDGSADGSPD